MTDSPDNHRHRRLHLPGPVSIDLYDPDTTFAFDMPDVLAAAAGELHGHACVLSDPTGQARARLPAGRAADVTAIDWTHTGCDLLAAPLMDPDDAVDRTVAAGALAAALVATPADRDIVITAVHNVIVAALQHPDGTARPRPLQQLADWWRNAGGDDPERQWTGRWDRLQELAGIARAPRPADVIAAMDAIGILAGTAPHAGSQPPGIARLIDGDTAAIDLTGGCAAATAAARLHLALLNLLVRRLLQRGSGFPPVVLIVGEAADVWHRGPLHLVADLGRSRGITLIGETDYAGAVRTRHMGTRAWANTRHLMFGGPNADSNAAHLAALIDFDHPPESPAPRPPGIPVVWDGLARPTLPAST